MHKNYNNLNYGGIYVYPDHISFTNHNRPIPPVTINDLNEKEVFDIRDYINSQIKEMCYRLNLIESYGSGIRHAKRALAENENKPPEFYPNNEIDDYTQVIMYINEEYKQYEDKDIIGEFNNKIKLPKNQQLVYDVIISNPGIRISRISEIIGLNENSVGNAIRVLKMKKLIEYHCPAKNGGYHIISFIALYKIN